MASGPSSTEAAGVAGSLASLASLASALAWSGAGRCAAKRTLRALRRSAPFSVAKTRGRVARSSTGGRTRAAAGGGCAPGPCRGGGGTANVRGGGAAACSCASHVTGLCSAPLDAKHVSQQYALPIARNRALRAQPRIAHTPPCRRTARRTSL